jgi:hypothetical protein
MLDSPGRILSRKPLEQKREKRSRAGPAAANCRSGSRENFHPADPGIYHLGRERNVQFAVGDCQVDGFDEGAIGLQARGKPVVFRNIFLNRQQ